MGFDSRQLPGTCFQHAQGGRGSSGGHGSSGRGNSGRTPPRVTSAATSVHVHLSPPFLNARGGAPLPAGWVIYGRLWGPTGPAAGTQTWRGVTGSDHGRLDSLTAFPGNTALAPLYAPENATMRIVAVRSGQDSGNEQTVLASLAAALPVRWRQAGTSVRLEHLYSVNRIVVQAGLRTPAAGSKVYVAPSPNGAVLRLTLDARGFPNAIHALVGEQNPRWEARNTNVIAAVGRAYTVLIDAPDAPDPLQDEPTFRRTLRTAHPFSPGEDDARALRLVAIPYASLSGVQQQLLAARGRVLGLRAQLQGRMIERLMRSGLDDAQARLAQEILVPDVGGEAITALERRGHDDQPTRRFFERLAGQVGAANEGVEHAESAGIIELWPEWTESNRVPRTSVPDFVRRPPDEWLHGLERAEEGSNWLGRAGSALGKLNQLLTVLQMWQEAREDAERRLAGINGADPLYRGIANLPNYEGANGLASLLWQIGGRLYDAVVRRGGRGPGADWLRRTMTTLTTPGLPEQRSSEAAQALDGFLAGVLGGLGLEVNREGVRRGWASLNADHFAGVGNSWRAGASAAQPDSADDEARADPVLRAQDALLRLREFNVGRLVERFTNFGLDERNARWAANAIVPHDTRHELDSLRERAEHESGAQHLLSTISSIGDHAGHVIEVAELAGCIELMGTVGVGITAGSGVLLPAIGFLCALGISIIEATERGHVEGEAAALARPFGYGLFGMASPLTARSRREARVLFDAGQRLYRSMMGTSGQGADLYAACRVLAQESVQTDEAIERLGRLVVPICRGLGAPDAADAISRSVAGTLSASGDGTEWHLARRNLGIEH